MPAKMARSAPRPPLGASTVMTAGRAANPSCQSAGKAQKFMPVGESSGEYRMILHPEWRIIEDICCVLSSFF
jgi:hypothetical protein